MESESIEIAGRKISLADWDATPESIKLVIEDLHGLVAGLSQRISTLEEKLNKNSKNSSIPPSKKGFGGEHKQEQKKQEQKIPKQRTKNSKSEKKLYAPEECMEIHEEKPSSCSACGEKLIGSDRQPYRHQIIELPIIRTVVNVDETGFKQYNRDGQNPSQTRGWLWVVVTPLVSYFAIVLSRSKATAQTLLGDFTGVVGSDRCPSYNWLNNDHRQVCWAHLLRDFQAMAERSGASAEIGTSLLKSGHRLFRCWIF